MNYAKNLSVGNEVVVQTNDGNCFKGIFMNIEKGSLGHRRARSYPYFPAHFCHKRNQSLRRYK